MATKTAPNKDGWKTLKLGEVCDINMGQSPESKFYNESGVGTPFLQGVTEFGELYPRIKKYTSKTTKMAKAGDILFSVRAPVGDINYASIACCIGRGLCSMKSKKDELNQKYFFYYLRQNNKEFINNSSGAIYDSINKDVLLNFPILLPPLATQKEIADVLSAYDDLIEINQKKIKILEDIAQTIYKEWFVKPTKNGLPDGWEIKKIGDLLSTVKRKNKIKTDEYLLEGKYPIIDQGKDFIAGYTNDESFIFNENLIVFGDHTRCFKYCNFSFATGADGTQLLKTKNPLEIQQIFLYFIAINAELKNDHYARHFKFLKTTEVTIPKKELVYKFSELAYILYEQIRELNLQNRNLQKTRDTLIPQLVGGKINLK